MSIDHGFQHEADKRATLRSDYTQVVINAQDQSGSRTTPCRGVVVCVVLGAVLSAAMMSSGCRRVLFRVDDDRTPYARYDRVRADEQPPYLQDEFGRRVPNLRGRLLGQ